MSVLASGPGVAVRAAAAPASLPRPQRAPVWSEVAAPDLFAWNALLLDSAVDLQQFPFWNEPLRMLGLTPHYVTWGPPGQPEGFLCILSAGPSWARVGLVFRGPSMLHGEPLPRAALDELMEWAYWQRYCFLRVTSADAHLCDLLSGLPYTLPADAFPFFQDFAVTSPDYVVDQNPEEAKTLASFDREIRRKLRRAGEAGYSFHSHRTEEALVSLWPLFLDSARRKQFHLERPLRFYRALIRHAPPHAVRIYSLQQKGERVGAALVLRDHNTAHCLLAAFDAAHRQGAAFLHWNAMRDMCALGAPRYNLGAGPGSLGRFKQQFVREPEASPKAYTVVLHEEYFRAWQRWLLPLALRLRPWLRTVACRSYRLFPTPRW